MKRRIMSLITVLALCLSLCPTWTLAAGWEPDTNLCSHHRVHTEECGYIPPASARDCAHEHDGNCFAAETLCIHRHTEDCYPEPEPDSSSDSEQEPSLCTHECSEDNGCVTLSQNCPHVHDEFCGYAPEDAGAPCAYVCRVCPIEELTGKLPRSVTPDNKSQVEDQLNAILALYTELTDGEQAQLDLSRCFDLQAQLDAASTPVLIDGGAQDPVVKEELAENRTVQKSLEVKTEYMFDTHEYSFTASKTTAIIVLGTGTLYLKGSAVTSKSGAGVEVQNGGTLIVEDSNLVVSGKTYGLDIASGAAAELSGGKFTGSTAAVRTADNDFGALLKPGYAYFDASGNPIPLASVAAAKTVVVKQCTDHSGREYTPASGAPAHDWNCPACGESVSAERCKFSFDEDGNAECVCGNTIEIAVDETSLGDLVYDSTDKTAAVTLTVKLNDGTVLAENTDYSVSCSTRSDVGEITVTVTGITYNGAFTKTYQVTQDQPAILWNPSSHSVDYNGSPVKESDMQSLITISIKAPNNEDLKSEVQYSYKKDGDTDFTNGLPTNAGTYEIKASLPESQNYKEAETNPCLKLTINKIRAVKTAPAAVSLTYNREAQELVTAGVLNPGAIAEGAKIEFAQAQNGPYSTDIPTGITVSNYDVWYKVEETENYSGETNKISARINHREITPAIELSYYKTLYDGGYMEPAVTVKDGEAIIPNTEYTVSYSNNRNVGQATVTVTNKSNGNYKIITATATFQITLKAQDALSITNPPDTVTYGDTFTLSTSGGSGNGEVTWKILDDRGDTGVATVNQNSGQVTITGHGSATVQATKSGTYGGVTNYEDAIATWTFTADQKPVIATVTADSRDYDGSPNATVHAVVEQGVLPGDEIKIDGLTGTFDDENAGTNKTVTVTGTPTISGDNSQHYDVTLSSWTAKADITKAVAHTTPPAPAALTYNGGAQALLAVGATVDTAGVLAEYALSENGPYSTDIPEATNAGNYEVWYRVQDTPNYTGTAAAKVTVTIQQKTVANPVITLTPNSYTYDSTAKEPDVTVNDDDGNPIDPSEYTVEYSNNINVGENASVTVTAKANGNYKFDTPANSVSATFRITYKTAQIVAAPEPIAPLTYNTREQKLVTAGTASGGTMLYAVADEDGTRTYSSAIPTATDAGTYTVYYKVKGDSNHADSHADDAADVPYVVVTIDPKVVKDPTIELKNPDGTLIRYTYDGTAKTPKPVVKDGSTPIAETEYDVTYINNRDAGLATVSITDNVGGNYTVTGTTTFAIDKADIVLAAPTSPGLTYNGKPQALLNGSTFDGGTILYSLSQNGTYTEAIPEKTEAGTYTVWYKVDADKNHNDFAAKSKDVTIARKALTAITIGLAPNSFEYDGKPHMPTVTVKDGNTVLPASEYTVTCTSADSTIEQNPTNEGTYTITIGNAADGNYDLSGVTANTEPFAIGKTAQEELMITDKPDTTNYGGTFQLTTDGGSGNGNVTWSVTAGPASVDNDGNVTITGIGEVTITAAKAESGNYFKAEAYWTFTATPKPVEAKVTVANKPYDSNTSATVSSVTVDTADLVNSMDQVVINGLTAAFDTPDVGSGKAVSLNASKVTVTGKDADKYDISYPGNVTAAVTQAAAAIIAAPASKEPLTYNGQLQELVTAGTANFGDVVYSLNGGTFSNTIPTAANAGNYTVSYKVVGNSNYTGVDEVTMPVVTIGPKPVTPKVEVSPSSYVYDGSKKEPKITVKDGTTVIDEDQYTFSWDNDLTSAGTHTVTITSENKNYTFTVNTTAQVEIKDAAQSALKITGKPSVVYYGDTITTLDTMGGSGNGNVTWEAAGPAAANGSNITITGVGEVTVTAKRTVQNYGTVEDTWTFTVQPKPVTAEVTVAPKDYDGKDTIAADAITAGVSARDLVAGDGPITITGLTGTYDDVNAGTNKTVTLYSYASSVIGNDDGKYSISYPATVTAAIKPKEVNVSVKLSEEGMKTDTDGITKYFEYDGAEKVPAVMVTASDGTVLSTSDYTVSYTNNKNVGDATVTVTKKAGGNYKFPDETATFKIKDSQAALTSTPQAKNLTYTGDPQELVTVGTAANGKVVYSENQAGPFSDKIPEGTVAKTYTVWYKVEGNSGYTNTAPRSVQVTIQPKTVVSPVITLGSYSETYSGNAIEPPVIEIKDGNTVIPPSEYTHDYSDNTNAGKATVHIINANGGNYIVNGTKTFEIKKAKAAFATEPSAKTLVYNGTAQELVTAGVPNGGTVVYSLNGGAYSTTIPTGTERTSYTVLAKVQGDSNHEDSEAVTIQNVSIDVNNVTNPTINLSSSNFTYNGREQKPTVEVRDNSGKIVPADEYDVEYEGDMVNQGTYTIKITSKGTNYSFSAAAEDKVTRTVTILAADQTALSITGQPNTVYYGDTLQLGTTGGSGNGTVAWTIITNEGETANATAVEGSAGKFKITGVGNIKIKATRTAASANYTDVESTWEFYAYKKPVTPIVTAADKSYDGNTTATLSISWKPGDLVGEDQITIDTSKITGEFATKDAGIDKQVEITVAPGATEEVDKYVISYPAATKASIYKVDAKLKTTPKEKAGLVYNAGEQDLLERGGVTENDIGVVEYSLNEKGEYSATIPKATNAGTYTVWYRVAESINYTGIGPVSKEVTIEKAETSVTSKPKASDITVGQPLKESELTEGVGSVNGSFAWTNGTETFREAGKYEREVTFTPDDTVNYKTSATLVEVTVNEATGGGDTGEDENSGGAGEGETSGGGSDSTNSETPVNNIPTNNTSTNNTPTTSGPSAASAPMQTSVQNGTATTVLNAAGGSELVKEAVANQSKNVIIMPEITGGVTKTEVSIPASTVSQLGSETNADLTVSTPVADVTIPNAALDTLSSAGGTIKAVTEQEENAVTLTLTAGGKSVGNVPGGVTLTIPVEDAGPGTVAVLVHEDGTRETIRKSVAEDGKISVPLDGSATVEIIDNSKAFADVPAQNWAAGAVAFASAHELFNGTSETTFSPDQSMSRGMLTTVLYNLEGQPAQSLTSEFSDVSSDAWYAAGVSWAAENGITYGYSDGQFAPNQSITREQFAVMLWRYAGSPAVDGQTLDFTDADEASGYAMEALRWAVANGILNGYGDGQLNPNGLTTRAQAAQMLKNFMENT